MERIYGIDARIVYFKWYTEKIFAIKLFCPNICQQAKPGQFMMIRGKNWNFNPLLNRPMSVARIDEEKSLLELQILVSGQGTHLLSQLQVNEQIEIIGPLGNSFTLPENAEKVALVAGGIGIAPLIFLDNKLGEEYQERLFFYGAVSKKELIPDEYIPNNIRLSTEDGSKGFKGYVTDDLRDFLSSIHRVYACGPTPMLMAVQELLKEYGVWGEISIETEMACGFGICQGCVVRKKDDKQEYFLACKDGPVFGADRVFLKHE